MLKLEIVPEVILAILVLFRAVFSHIHQTNLLHCPKIQSQNKVFIKERGMRQNYWNLQTGTETLTQRRHGSSVTVFRRVQFTPCLLND